VSAALLEAVSVVTFWLGRSGTTTVSAIVPTRNRADNVFDGISGT
jgi:hypothetical protein